MPVVYKRFGSTVEITRYEKEVNKTKKNNSFSIRRKEDFAYGARRFDSLRRSKRILVRRVLCAIEDYGVPLLCTFTFDGCATEPIRYTDAVRKFLLRLSREYKEAVCIIVPEFSPNKRIHGHALIFGLPLCWGDIKKGKKRVFYGDERRTRKLAKMWGQGYVDCVQTDGSEKLAGYLGKYFSKAFDEPMFYGMRLVRMSKMFPNEIIVREKLAEELAKVYSKKVTQWSWFYDSPWLGRIEKNYYKIETV